MNKKLEGKKDFYIENNDTGDKDIQKVKGFILNNFTNILNTDNCDILNKGDYKNIEKYFYRIFEILLKKSKEENSYSIFDNFFDDIFEKGEDKGIKNNIIGDNKNKILLNSKYKIKMEKYFPIHIHILLKYLSKEIDENKTDIENENILKNFIKKYLNIIFVFGEKIKLSGLEKLLELDVKVLNVLYSTVSKKIESLDILEKSIIGNDKINNKLQNNLIYSSIYRNTFKKVALESDENINLVKIIELVSINIEKLFKKEFEEIFDVFEKWIDSDGIAGENLEYMEDVIKKFLIGITVFKDQDVAFSNSIFLKYKQIGFTDEVFDFLGSKIKGGKNKDKFKTFLNLSLLEKENKYDNFIGEIKNEKRLITKSRLPSLENWENVENVDITNVGFSEWQNLPERQKYYKIFEELFYENKDNIIQISEELKIAKLDNNKYKNIINENDLKLFCDILNINSNVVNGQFNSIIFQLNEGISLEDFIEKDVNNLNLIYIWWRFILKTRSLKSENKEVNKNNIIKIKEEYYGVIEKISKGLDNIGILNNDKIEFKPDGRLINTSIHNINEQLLTIINGLKKGPIDLIDTKIIKDGKKININSVIGLYIPEGVSDNEDGFDKILNWINSGIDLSVKLLKGDLNFTDIERDYLDSLIKLKILSSNINELSIKDKVNLQDLFEGLKFIKNRRKKLQKMMSVAREDRKILDSLLINFGCEFGPEKTFSRAFIKLIKNYSGDFTSLGDLTRLRVSKGSIDSLIDSVVDFISIASESDIVKHISIIDYTGEPLSEPKKKTGYREIKLLFTLTSGNVVEIQFHYDEMLKMKEKGINLDMNDNSFIFDKLKAEDSLFTQDEMKELLILSKNKNISLLNTEILNKFLNSGSIYSLISEVGIQEELFSKNFISTVATYDLSRQLHKNSTLKKKIIRLERILSDIAWGKIVLDYLNIKK